MRLCGGCAEDWLFGNGALLDELVFGILGVLDVLPGLFGPDADCDVPWPEDLRACSVMVLIFIVNKKDEICKKKERTRI